MPSYTAPDYVLKRPRTRIVCTLGPATASDEMIDDLIQAGMSVARLNLSHGSPEDHTEAIARVRERSERAGVAVAVLADLPGPKHRLGSAPDADSGAEIVLEVGQRYMLRDGNGTSTNEVGYVHPPGFVSSTPAGADVLIADGAIRLSVKQARQNEIECEVTVGGPIQSDKAVSAPGHASRISYLTEETGEALAMAASQHVDYVGISYIRSAADVRLVRDFFAARDFHPELIAKIELAESMDNLNAIIDASDGVMVARGDLGVELPIALVPGSQKTIIRRANEVGKVVITATQMLESMINAPTPTRAEVTDVANAILDGTDAIMLSAETSVGQYPAVATAVMAEVALEAEKTLNRREIADRRRTGIQGLDSAIADAAVSTAVSVDAKVILAFTESGSTAGRVAGFRPGVPIIVITPDSAVGRGLALRWGVMVITAPRPRSIDEMFRQGSQIALDSGLVKEKERAVAVIGVPIGVHGSTNLLRVIDLPEPNLES
ncbi:MAG TPA: pyruvate kinase [Dehalococcoidia bacterium]|nr:pyruvate kinase [Chloroflexota bacterium]MDP5877094.1 pyruvate kinase [Dehalococcoidia bacterium]MDP6272595.1 pyruvate kinase [Dehalococcoidia bacterium]MDP7161091.1 pyruvate kinase [Dehalococcoidia bacterium]MDP7213999.1 pyruvate kinase [Dehalococcoidia bacterium]